MSVRYLPEVNGQSAPEANNLTSTYETIVSKCGSFDVSQSYKYISTDPVSGIVLPFPTPNYEFKEPRFYTLTTASVKRRDVLILR
jgi:hypothetical protein